MKTIEDAFKELENIKLTENGDKAYKSTTNLFLDILFKSEYYSHHLCEVPEIGESCFAKLFAMFVRDPRFGLGKRDLGRVLMNKAKVSMQDVVKAGRYDDLFYIFSPEECNEVFKNEILNGNELAKKWAPRYSSKNLHIARQFAAAWGMNKQQYGKFVKCDTVESKLTSKETDRIEFGKVPSLAMLKYAKRFASKEDTKDRYNDYMESVKSGKADIHVATTTVYDIYRNRKSIDPDVFFDKIEKINISCIPVVDTSGSMTWIESDDAIGKALSIGHYLSKCSTDMPNKVITFSSEPILLTLGEDNKRFQNRDIDEWCKSTRYSICGLNEGKSKYENELYSMMTGDCSNTDLSKVMELLSECDILPNYIVILSDMEFDYGSSDSRASLEALWEKKGYTTKIVWWNLNGRKQTVPEVSSCGNIYMSGYSPYLLKFLKAGFDGEEFMNELIVEYAKKISD